MLWYSVIVIWVMCWQCAVCFYDHQNNVCRTLRDYKTIDHNKNCSYNPDVGSTPRLIAKRYGYPFEIHSVTTDDGYILNLHRIPGSRNGGGPSNDDKRQPVLMFHGLAGMSSFWMLQGRKSLAFFLADNGYDVWLANMRGTYHSSKHINMTLKKSDYWNFGFHEVAIYDLPACIDFIANRTGEKGNLTYVGHSLGTTISYVYATQRQKHAEDNLKAIISLAPVAYMGNVMGSFRLLAPFASFMSEILESNGIYVVGQQFELQRSLMRVTCSRYPLIIPCTLVLAFSSGLSLEQFQPELLPVFFSYYPSAVSLRTLKHLAQIIENNGRFQMYDHGPSKNLEIYNTTVPPEYEVDKISVPVYLFVGSEDAISGVEDAKLLEQRLNSGKRDSGVKIYLFNYAHHDFVIGKSPSPMHNTLLQAIRTYSLLSENSSFASF